MSVPADKDTIKALLTIIALGSVVALMWAFIVYAFMRGNVTVDVSGSIPISLFLGSFFTIVGLAIGWVYDRIVRPLTRQAQ
jgi:hypothetical protein